MWWTTDCCNVDSAYDARLRETFPIGSSEQDLKATLAAQGFEFAPEGGKAIVHWSDLACSHSADVEWHLNAAGSIAAVRGDVWSACV